MHEILATNKNKTCLDKKLKAPFSSQVAIGLCLKWVTSSLIASLNSQKTLNRLACYRQSYLIIRQDIQIPAKGGQSPPGVSSASRSCLDSGRGRTWRGRRTETCTPSSTRRQSPGRRWCGCRSETRGRWSCRRCWWCPGSSLRETCNTWKNPEQVKLIISRKKEPTLILSNGTEDRKF